MQLDFNKIFQCLVVVVLIYVILILNTIYQGKPTLAQASGGASYVAAAPEVPTFPIKITNIEQFSPKFTAAFPVNKENQFVVVDNLNRIITLYEITWNGPTAAIQSKTHTSF